MINEYDRKEFQYDKLIPLVLVSANRDDGLFVGGGFMATKHGFRKSPNKNTHLITGKYAFATNAYNFQYKGIFTSLIGKWDFSVRLKALAPNYVTNFFGAGNESVYFKNTDEIYNLDDEIDFYRTRFNQYSIETFLTRNLGNRTTVSFGHHWQSFQISNDYNGEDRFILDASNGLPTETLFDRKTYDGAMLFLEYDGKDNKIMPTHGFYTNLDLRRYLGVNQEALDFTKFIGELAYYKTVRLPAKITIATRIGGGHNFGNYEFYQGQVLDGNTNIRGYRKTRFFGDSKIYNNTELRTRLFNFRNKIVPLSVGMTVFNDVGRVWLDGENSDKWHHGYGAGLWFSPLNALVLSVDFATSEEEDLIGYFKLGFRF